MKWVWTPQHTEALDILKDKLKIYEKLGLLHPQDLLKVKWGFAEHASYCGIFQKGPYGLVRPSFSSTTFKETEQWYSEWEKGLLSLTWAVMEVEGLCTSQDIIMQGPFPLLNSVLKGLLLLKGVAQKATTWKWYVYLEGISQLLPLKEGSVKVSKLQQSVNPDSILLSLPCKPSPIEEAPELIQNSDTWGVWFTDVSAVVQDWARGEGIKWVFHILYYLQAKWTMEWTKGLIKKHTDVLQPLWDTQLTQAVLIVNNHWGS